ncbi:hypothetical protein MRB53_039261 [Persea americana]|nr:hypothetical protein MRB53_039261 [Persea americana]
MSLENPRRAGRYMLTANAAQQHLSFDIQPRNCGDNGESRVDLIGTRGAATRPHSVARDSPSRKPSTTSSSRCDRR